MDTTEDKGNGTGAATHNLSCDRYPDACPLVQRTRGNIRRMASVEGTDEDIREFMKDPQKFWEALNDLEENFDQISDKISSVADEVSRVSSAPRVGIEEIDRVAKWQKTILIITMVVAILVLGAMGFFNHRFDNLWNRAQTTIGVSP